MEHINLDNEEFQKALQIIQFTRRSLFLTGKAGTGKSTFLRYISETTKKKHVILAPTGIAAINAGGSTLHSFFKLPFHPLLPNDTRYNVRNMRKTLRYTSEKCKLLREVELIIIDEISMVRADIIDFIDKVLRVYNRNMREPFGGKQLLLVGDIYQLEPVVREEDRQLLAPFYHSQFFFDAKVFASLQLVSIELTKVYRQNNPTFIKLLDHIRSSHVTTADLEMLNRQVGADIDTSDSSLSITLSTRRDTVDYINSTRLAELDGDATIFDGTIEGDFPENNLPSPLKLELKVGAQVLFVRNDKEKRWVNGTLGTVTGFSLDVEDSKDAIIYVRTEDGVEFDVEQEIWSNIKYTFNEKEQKIEESVLGTFCQFPLRLAWAITVHKSQGLTFRNVKSISAAESLPAVRPMLPFRAAVRSKASASRAPSGVKMSSSKPKFPVSPRTITTSSLFMLLSNRARPTSSIMMPSRPLMQATCRPRWTTSSSLSIAVTTSNALLPSATSVASSMSLTRRTRR